MQDNQLEYRLIEQAKSGNESAFIRLVERYKDKIYYLGLRMLRSAQDAEDVAQETFLRVYTNLHRFDAKHRFSTWIYRIASNLCIDRIRKRKPQYSLDEPIEGGEGGQDWYSRQAADERTPEESVIALETRTRVLDALEHLPAHYRAVIVLRYFHDLSLAEIGEVLSLPVTTVKTRVHRGREALRRILSSHDK